jgi:hypothetical protein
MGEAKLRRSKGPSDYFLSTLFSREYNSPVERESVMAHEIGHAVVNTLLDYPIEFTSVTWTLDDEIRGFTKNLAGAKAIVEASLRLNDRVRAMQIAAIHFAGPLAEYIALIRRSAGTDALSFGARTDKGAAFQMFCCANAIMGGAPYHPETGDLDLSSDALRPLKPAWEKWKVDCYDLAKATLCAPGVGACADSFVARMLDRLRRGAEVRIEGSEIGAALSALPLIW